MRNLKRVLALAMAMVMILGMMVIGSSAASYSDKAAINEDYAVSVEVLSGMGIFKGTGAGFAPKQILTRAEAAALIYRVITGDVNDKQAQNYDYASLNDIKAGQWYTPYVTYANNGGYIKGDDLGNFNPNAQVTGVQIMAIMLRAAGYGQNGEYEGAAWMDNILTDAKELGITGTISTATLNAPATRELVAQLIWNAITKVEMVSYAPLLGYTKVNVGTIWKPATQTLAEKVFKLTSTKGEHDTWGRPTTIWYNDDKGTVKGFYAEIVDTPAATYTVATVECDIAADLGLKKADGTVTKLTINGEKQTTINLNGNNEINRLATKAVIGAQGRLTEVYEVYDAAAKETNYEIVMIDQYLAKVTGVTEVEYDKNGHIAYQAELDLAIYTDDTSSTDTYTAVTLKADTDWEYAKNDMLLVYYDADGEGNKAEIVEFVDYAESMTGAQTAFTNKANTHIVEDTEYADAVQFNLDQAGVETTDHIWYFDTYGNLIAVVNPASAAPSYGVISSIYWKDSHDGEDGKAIATITYIDGTSESATVYSIKETTDVTADVLTSGDSSSNYEAGKVSETKSYNKDEYVNVALYKITNDPKGRGLVLTETEVLPADTTIETGVPAISDDLNAGASTKFLVWNGKTYETYTGIKNVPTYEGVVYGWYYNAKASDGVADGIFLIKPVDASATTTVTYYYDSNLTVKAHLKNSAVEYYSVIGGYVNGVKETLLIDADNFADIAAVRAALTEETLMVVTLTDGYVVETTDIEIVNDIPAAVATKTYAVYAGKLSEASVVDDDLIAESGVYDATDYTLINSVAANWSLTKTKTNIAADKVEGVDEAYLYVVYTEGKTGYKTAQYVYVSSVEGETYVPETPAVPNNLRSAVINGVEVTKVTGGAGTAADPYKVVAASCFYGVRNYSLKVTALTTAQEIKIGHTKTDLTKGTGLGFASDIGTGAVEPGNTWYFTIDGTWYVATIKVLSHDVTVTSNASTKMEVASDTIYIASSVADESDTEAEVQLALETYLDTTATMDYDDQTETVTVTAECGNKAVFNVEFVVTVPFVTP